mmetsp:Transcript_101207/g.325148  ORF Transcript_101207/g.325148 Transcript_101207/m.325148 type:complete len:204 (-) Transcript_101207:638-1249(-)
MQRRGRRQGGSQPAASAERTRPEPARRVAAQTATTRGGARRTRRPRGSRFPVAWTRSSLVLVALTATVPDAGGRLPPKAGPRLPAPPYNGRPLPSAARRTAAVAAASSAPSVGARGARASPHRGARPAARPTASGLARRTHNPNARGSRVSPCRASIARAGRTAPQRCQTMSKAVGGVEAAAAAAAAAAAGPPKRPGSPCSRS